jgi:NitT/TauT family transport system ATP-binding protein
MSARPGRIVEELVVPFEYPRGHDIRYSPEFAELNGRVSAALRASS